MDINTCDYLVDSSFPWSHHGKEDPLEPDYILHGDQWERVHCAKFLDAANTPRLGRSLWIPGMLDQRKWGLYCLLKRREGYIPVPSENETVSEDDSDEDIPALDVERLGKHTSIRDEL